MQDIDNMIKVVDILEADEKNVSKIEQARKIIKGLLKALYNDKFTNFLLSSVFLYMVYAGIVEEYYLVSVIYGFAFLRFTDFRSAYQYAKEIINEYKKKKDNIDENILVEGATIYEEITCEEKDFELSK